MVKTALELAKNTIDILNENGWRQGAADPFGDTAVCLGEAIGRAYTSPITPEEDEKQTEQMTKLRLTMEAVIWEGGIEPRDDWGPIVEWNDAPGRTKQEVMEVLDKTMDILIPAVA